MIWNQLLKRHLRMWNRVRNSHYSSTKIMFLFFFFSFPINLASCSLQFYWNDLIKLLEIVLWTASTVLLGLPTIKLPTTLVWRLLPFSVYVKIVLQRFIFCPSAWFFNWALCSLLSLSKKYSFHHFICPHLEDTFFFTNALANIFNWSAFISLLLLKQVCSITAAIGRSQTSQLWAVLALGCNILVNSGWYGCSGFCHLVNSCHI